MGKKDFDHLKSTLAAIAKMELELIQLTEIKDKPKTETEDKLQIIDTENPMAIFDIDYESNSDSTDRDSNDFRDRKLKLEKEVNWLENKIQQCLVPLKGLEDQANESEESIRLISTKMENSKVELELVNRKISDLEDDHFDGQNWKIYKSQNLTNKIKQIEGMGRIKEGLNNQRATFIGVVLLLVGIYIGLSLVLGENYEFECNDGEKIAGWDVDDTYDDCTNGEDETDAAKEHRNIIFEGFACCVIPIGFALMPSIITEWRGESRASKIELEIFTLRQDFEQKHGELLAELEYLESNKLRSENYIKYLESEFDRIEKIPNRIEELNSTLTVYTNRLDNGKKELEDLIIGHESRISELENGIASAWDSIIQLIPYSEKI